LEHKNTEKYHVKAVNVIKNKVFGINYKEISKYVTDAKLHEINHALYVNN
jgi:hypothetical protein